jgi:hypothetical protein
MTINKPRPSTSTRGGVSSPCHFTIVCSFLALFILYMQLGVAHDLALLELKIAANDCTEKEANSATSMLNNIIQQQDNSMKKEYSTSMMRNTVQQDNNIIIDDDQKNSAVATAAEEEAAAEAAKAATEEAAAKIAAEAAAAAAAEEEKEKAAAAEVAPATAEVEVEAAPATTTTNKPTLLLHLGPPKTSTTYLQCILTNMMDTLALDNYVYVGLHVWQCLKNETQIPDPLNTGTDFLLENQQVATAGLSPSFLNQLRDSHEKGQNAIIMNECFNEFLPEHRQLIYDELSANWNVKLIMNYRRVYECLPSYYNQNHKPNEYRSDYESLTLWPGETAYHDDGDGGAVVGVPLFPFNIDEYRIKSLLNRMEYKGQFGHPVSQLLHKFES